MSGCRTDLDRGVDGIVYLDGGLLLWGWSLSRLHGGKVGSGAEEGRKRRRSQGEGEDARRDALTGVLSEPQLGPRGRHHRDPVSASPVTVTPVIPGVCCSGGRRALRLAPVDVVGARGLCCHNDCDPASAIAGLSVLSLTPPPRCSRIPESL